MDQGEKTDFISRMKGEMNDPKANQLITAPRASPQPSAARVRGGGCASFCHSPRWGGDTPDAMRIYGVRSIFALRGSVGIADGGAPSLRVRRTEPGMHIDEREGRVKILHRNAHPSSLTVIYHHVPRSKHRTFLPLRLLSPPPSPPLKG